MKFLIMASLYFNMACSITVGEVQMDVCNSVKISQSIKQLSDTAEIVLPRNFANSQVAGKVDSLERKNILDFIKVNDPVKIDLGYDDDVETEFEGYVTQVGSDIPLLIKCEDEMWMLKKSTFNKTFKKVKLSELLLFIAPGYTYEIIDDIDLGKFIIQKASAYETLEALRKDYLLHSYFKGKTLVVGFPANLNPEVKHQYNLSRNIRDASSLEFLRKDDVKLQIKAISNNSDGTKTIETVGETGGATRTLNFANKSANDLKLLAEQNLATLSFDGFQGSLSAFGIPRVKAGEAVALTDPNFENSEREGDYLIEGVEKTFNKNDGFKNEVKLSLKIS